MSHGNVSMELTEGTLSRREGYVCSRTLCRLDGGDRRWTFRLCLRAVARSLTRSLGPSARSVLLDRKERSLSRTTLSLGVSRPREAEFAPLLTHSLSLSLSLSFC